MDKMNITLKNENDENVEYEVICTFDSDDGVHKYICYTNNEKDLNGEEIIYVSAYKEEDNKMKVFPIDNKEEWNWVMSRFNDINEN